MKAGGEHRRQI